MVEIGRVCSAAVVVTGFCGSVSAGCDCVVVVVVSVIAGMVTGAVVVSAVDDCIDVL